VWLQEALQFEGSPRGAPPAFSAGVIERTADDRGACDHEASDP
jgi:hypothetical protein